MQQPTPVDTALLHLFAAAPGSTRMTFKPREGVDLEAWRAAPANAVRILGPSRDGAGVVIARSAGLFQDETDLRAALTSAADRVTVLWATDPERTARCVLERGGLTVTVLVPAHVPARTAAIRRALRDAHVTAVRVEQLRVVTPAELSAAPQQRLVVDQAHLLGSAGHAAWARLLPMFLSVDLLGCDVPSPAPGWSLMHVAAAVSCVRVTNDDALQRLWAAMPDRDWSRSCVVYDEKLPAAMVKLGARPDRDQWLVRPAADTGAVHPAEIVMMRKRGLLRHVRIVTLANAAMEVAVADVRYWISDATAQRLMFEEWQLLLGLPFLPLVLVRPDNGPAEDGATLCGRVLNDYLAKLRHAYARSLLVNPT